MEGVPVGKDIAGGGAAPGLVPLARIELLHISALSVTVFLALLAHGGGRGELAVPIFASAALLSLIGLAAARSLRKEFSDLYRQLQYRGKFVLFLLHCALVALPWMAGIREVEVLGGILLVVLSLQGFNPLFWGRILFVGAALVFLSLVGGQPPPGWFLAVWLAGFLVAARLGHLRWRLLLHGGAGYRGGGAMLRRSLVPVVLPPALAWALYEGFRLLGIPRSDFVSDISLSPEGTERTVELFTLETLWQALILLAGLVAALVLLWWLDRQLRSRRKPGMEEEGIGTAAVRPHRERAGVEEAMVPEVTSGPRQRILAAFARFAASLEPAGLGRAESESAEVWFGRLAGLLNVLPARELELFDRACYSTEPVGEEEADEFVRQLRRDRDVIEHRLDEWRQEAQEGRLG